jgi:hypothetical protein
MAINKDIGSKISEMAQSAELSPAPVFDTEAAVQEQVEAPMQMGLEFPEYEQTAVLGKLFKKGAQKIDGLTVTEALEPLTKKGVRIKQEPKIIPDPPPVAPAPQVVNPKAAAKPNIAPVPLDQMNKVAAERERMLAEGTTRGTTKETPINTMVYDNDEFAATVRASAENATKNRPTMTVLEIRNEMINAGVHENIATRILQGLPLESKIGDSQLAQNVGGVVELARSSAAVLDDLFAKLKRGELDQAGQLELRQQMAYNNLILQQMKGVQVDIGRSLNMFKDVKQYGRALPPERLRQLLDEAGGEEALLRLADDYLSLPTRKGRNQLLEAGLGQRLRETWINVWQSNLLTDIAPHAYSLTQGILNTARAPIERMVAVGVGQMRQSSVGGFRLINSPAAQTEYAGAERYYMADVQARMSGLRNGIYDAWMTMAKGGPQVRIPLTEVDITLPTFFNKDYAVRANAKGDAPISPLSGAGFSDLPVRLPFSTTELFRTPDFTNGWTGKVLNGLGYMYSVPFRALRAADDFVGMTVSRMQLHEEAWHLAQKEYDKFVVSGSTHDDALAETQRIVASFMDERPASMQASMEKAHKIATASEDFNKETKLNAAYWRLDRAFQHGLIKPFLPFSRSITNDFLHTAAATPGWNLISPKFWDAWNAGGRERDLAIARLSIGSAAGYVAVDLATEGKITGSGPFKTQDRKALEALGWQKYSRVFAPGELSPDVKARLSTLTTLTEGKGDFEGYTFVSYARFGFSPILAQGADFADAQRFHVGKPDETEWAKWALSIAGSNLNYLQNHPQAAAFGDMVGIMSAKIEDGGEKVYDVLRRIGKQYVDVLYTGTPLIGSTNASAIAHIERLHDPLVRSTRIDQMNAPEHIRLVAEQGNRVLSRMPYYSDGLQAELDDIGRPRYVDVNLYETYANFIPIVQARKGKRDLYNEAMVSIDHGTSRPRDVWNGVSLSTTQYNRYKKLYGQEVMIDPSLFTPTAEGPPMNLEKAVPFLLEQEREYRLSEGRQFGIGDAQDFVNGVIKKYRRIAKLKMIGYDFSPETGQGELPDSTELDFSEYGLYDNKVEFPELGAMIDRNKKFYSRYGK